MTTTDKDDLVLVVRVTANDDADAADVEDDPGAGGEIRHAHFSGDARRPAGRATGGRERDPRAADDERERAGGRCS